MRFREILDFSAPILTENKKQYQQMMQSLITAGYLNSEQAKEVIDEARQKLMRQDRVVWWLKYMKALIVEQDMYNSNAETMQIMRLDKQGVAGQDRIDQLQRWKEKAIGWKPAATDLNDFRRFFLLNIDHISSMFDVSDRYDSVVWETTSSPAELNRTLATEEEKWQQKRKRWISTDNEAVDDVILTYDNNQYAWVKLDRAYCRIEGDAMGHCGNTASWRDGDQIYSFRKLESARQKPYLTFILDKNGFLGEMKGYANEKPDSKYHRYIVDLLMQPFVTGIKGGGYDAENNFKLSDLDDATQKKLIQKKPEIGGPIVAYIENDSQYNEKIGQQMISLIDGVDWQYQSFDVSTGKIVIHQFNSLTEIGDYFQDNALEYAGKVLNGELDFGVDYLYTNISDNIDNYSDGVSDIIDGLDEKTKEQLERYIDHIGDWDDESLTDKVIYMAKDNNAVADAIVDALVYGISAGAQTEMMQNAYESLTHNGFEQVDSKWQWTINIIEILNTFKFNHIVDMEDVLEKLEYDDDKWRGFIDYDNLQEPHYGWDGFDVDVAIETFVDSLTDNDEYYNFITKSSAT